MKTLGKTDLKNIYEIDEHLWLEETIKLLRENRFNDLDLDNLIEELESLGRRDLNKVRSLLRQTIIHILLLQYWSQEYERNYRHWQGEIKTFRFELNNNLTTNLTNKLTEELQNIYESAVEFVEVKTGFQSKTFPNQCPYTLNQLLDKDWLPSTNK